MSWRRRKQNAHVKSGALEMAELAERLRAMPAEVMRDAQIALARTLHAYLKKAYAAHREPGGKPWEKTELGRAPAMSGRFLTVGYSGTRVTATLRFYEAMHSRGLARGRKARPMLPTGGMPADLRSAMFKVLDDVYGGPA